MEILDCVLALRCEEAEEEEADEENEEEDMGSAVE